MAYTIPQLKRLCLEAEQLFRRNQPSDRASCLEIFRRAIISQEPEAWRALMDIYHPQVEAWIRRHPLSSKLNAPMEDLSAQAFSRFWQALTPERFRLKQPWTLLQLMAYLHRTVESIIHDSFRAQATAWVSLDSIQQGAPDNTVALIARMDCEETWRQVQSALRDDAERLVIELIYRQGMTPREVAALHSDIFPSVTNVYRVQSRVIRRLRRRLNIEQVHKMDKKV